MIGGSHNGPHAITAATRQGPDSAAGRPSLGSAALFPTTRTHANSVPAPSPPHHAGWERVLNSGTRFELPPNRGLQCFVAVAPRSVENAAKVQI